MEFVTICGYNTLVLTCLAEHSAVASGAVPPYPHQGCAPGPQWRTSISYTYSSVPA